MICCLTLSYGVQEVYVKLTEVAVDESRGEFKINGTLRTVHQETGDAAFGLMLVNMITLIN